MGEGGGIGFLTFLLLLAITAHLLGYSYIAKLSFWAAVIFVCLILAIAAVVFGTYLLVLVVEYLTKRW